MDQVILAKENGNDVSDMRTAYCEAMIELAEKDSRIVAVDADLMSAMGMKPFAKQFPERTVDCGIQEANMIGVACGLSVWGKIPFAHTFGPFCTRRACDQIFMSGAYNKANVKVVGSDPGITAAYNGGTHMPFEDMGIMRGIPTMTVVEPTDIVMLKNLMPQIADTYGMFYMRLVRKGVRKVYEPGSTFTIGKAVHLREGKDVTIIGTKDTVIDMKEKLNNGATNVSLEGVTVEFGSSDYKGFQHTGKLIYKDCVIKGKQFLYGENVEFIGCTFEQENVDYNVWTYGAGNVLFENCVFNCVGKAVLIYNEGHIGAQSVEFRNCTFNASAPVEGKAAIEIDSSFNVNYTVIIDKATSEQVTGFGLGSKSGNSVWNEKKGNKTTVIVNGETVRTANV